MNFNKRGLSGTVWAFIVIGGLFLLFLLIGLLTTSAAWESLIGVGTAIDTSVSGFDDALGRGFVWMNYVFGGLSLFLLSTVGATSAIVITLAVWLFVFLTFGDVLATFGTFSKWVSWSVAFLLAVITANLKGLVALTVFFISIFSFLGTLAVIAGAFSAFVAFFAVNWGIRGLAPWLMRRRAMDYASKKALDSEAGGRELAGTVRGLKEVGKALGEK